VLRQLLAESLLLAVVGGVLGVGLAYFALDAFLAGWPTMLPRMQDIEVNAPVLLFSLALSVAAGVLFGLVPAVGVAGGSLAESLRRSSRSVTGDRSRRLMRTGLVVAEVGLAVVLLVGTGLLVRSFGALQAEDPGFVRHDRLVLSTPLPRAKYTTAEGMLGYADAALDRLEAVPGAESVAFTSLMPLAGDDQIWGFWREERAVSGADEDGSALFYRVSPGYFKTMGIPILAGRGIGSEDRADGEQVVVISESLATETFPGQDPLGRMLKFGTDDDDPVAQVVGVVGEVQHYDLGRSSLPQLYVPFTQRPTGDITFVIQASIPPSALVSGVREAIGVVDPDQPLAEVQAADAMVSATIAMPRFRTLLMTAFGLVALVLAVVGLYGVMAYNVSQRSKEIGVRMALGASRGSVLGLVFRGGYPLVGIGLAVGLVGALVLSRVLDSMLFEVGSRDPGVFAGVPLILLAVATLAMLVPARRAARVDPVKTLGEE
jgi:putative ABC transport system permease protein